MDTNETARAYELLQITYKEEVENRIKYINLLESVHREELSRKNKEIKLLNKEIERLHYTIEGACAKNLQLNVSINPTLLADRANLGVAREIERNAVRRMASQVEEQLGDRYTLREDYNRALKHIFYLEHHMKAYNIKFTEWGIPAREVK